MCKYFTKLLKYGANIAQILCKYCANIALILRKYCANIVQIVKVSDDTSLYFMTTDYK